MDVLVHYLRLVLSTTGFPLLPLREAVAGLSVVLLEWLEIGDLELLGDFVQE